MAIVVLGLWHGINPGMGWLFAVALGMQEQRSRAVWRALLPLALGHGIAIGGAVLLAVAIGYVVPTSGLKWAVAAILLAFGTYRLFRHRHPRWSRMRVGMRELTLWSLLMASAHGAGLMVVPFVLESESSSRLRHETRALSTVSEDTRPATAGSAASHASHQRHAVHSASIVATMPGQEVTAMAVTVVHTLAYLMVTGLIAVAVYQRLGLRLLRRVWFNLDLLWGAALIGTAVLTPLI